MKIIFITSEGFDTSGPMNHSNLTILEDFLALGHSVHLVQSKRDGLFSEVPKSLNSEVNFSYYSINRKKIDKKIKKKDL